jgi:hypothetical protein
LAEHFSHLSFSSLAKGLGMAIVKGKVASVERPRCEKTHTGGAKDQETSGDSLDALGRLRSVVASFR